MPIPKIDKITRLAVASHVDTHCRYVALSGYDVGLVFGDKPLDANENIHSQSCEECIKGMSSLRSV